MINVGIFQRGETITQRIGVTVGSVSDIVGLPTARMKPMRRGSMAVPAETIPGIDLIVTPAGSDASGVAGWAVTVTAAQSASMLPGNHMIELRCQLGTGVYKSEGIVVRIIDSVTA